MAATTTSGEVFWSSLHHNTADDCCNPAGADDYCMDDDNYDEETYCPYVYSMEGDPVNWQERCIELEMSLQRFRDQAGKIRGLLREKVSHNQSTVSFHLVLLCCGRRNSGRFPRGLLLFFFWFVFRLRIDRTNFSSRHFIPFPSDRNGILFKSALMFTRNAESLERSCTCFQWVVDMLPSSGRVFLYVPFHGRVPQRTEFFKFFQSDP